MGKIGLFGGSFDPPHMGHFKLAEAVITHFGLDKIIFIPAGNPPHKADKKLADKEHRFKMVERAISKKSEFLISDFDIKNEKPNYSYITIEHFKKSYPCDKIFFIVGADSYRDFPLWKNYPDILSLCTFIVAGRKGVDCKECFLKYKEIEPSHSALFLEDFSYDLSSTEIRKTIHDSKSSTLDIPKSVLDYIKEHNLYS